MGNVAGQWIQRLMRADWARQAVRSLRLSLSLPRNATVLVHIGKCGGRSLREGIGHAQRHGDVHPVHIQKPIFRRDLKYIIIARNPISRLLSAFNWRYRLVVEEGSQKDRFKGEHAVLSKYGSLNALAEALYDRDGVPDATAQREIRLIHHIREDIAFYLSDLLEKCRPDQVVAVLMQERLDEDIARVFGYRNEIRQHTNPAGKEASELSDTARANLRRFFVRDFEALTRLYCWGMIERDVFNSVM